MPSVLDAAAYILNKLGPMTAMKLQKLIYYSQAWSLVWDDEPLFNEEIQAWANGPVAPCLYDKHRGQFKVDTIPGNPEALTPNQRDSVDKIIESYGDKSSQWLSDLTHMEAPWREARKNAGLRDGERGKAVITQAAMAEYYSSL